MRPSTIGLLFTLCAAPFSAIVATPSKSRAHKVKETVTPPNGWIKHSAPARDHIIVLRIGLPQPNFHVLEKHLYEVSDPDHERYGAHLSKEEVEALVAPHQESVNLVDEWLQSHDIGEHDLVRSPAKDWVTLKIPVSLVEKMLDTVCLVSRPVSAILHDMFLRNTTCGSMSIAVNLLSGQLAIVSRAICTSMSMLFSQRQSSAGQRGPNPPLFGRMTNRHPRN